jgi:glutamine cyclotransferase
MALGVAGCGKSGASGEASLPPLPAESVASGVKQFGYEVIRALPHDRAAFTQGLQVWHGGFIESTGLNGRSSLREVEIATGRILKQVPLAHVYFGEGATVLDDKIYQLTWQNHKGFIYDADTFAQVGEFAYEGEGWGLTTDGQALILSDGTSRIRFLDPKDFRVTRTIDVTANGRPVDQLNELEFVRGEILANVWRTDRIVRIDAATGHVRGEVDLSGLVAPQDRTPDADVLNGIAYDVEHDRLFVTGKLWSKVYEVRLKPKN